MGCLCQKPFSVLPFMRQISNPCRGSATRRPYVADGGTVTISNILCGLFAAALCRLLVRNNKVCAIVPISSAAVLRVAAPYKAPAKKKAFSFKSFFDMFSSPQKILQGAEFYFCYSSIFIPLSLNRFLRRSTDDELSAVFESINALSAAI